MDIVIPFGTVVTWLTILATAVMAASASIQAVRHGFDLFGAMFLALATAVGGGTVRDLLLGRVPVFWIGDHLYLATAVPVAALGFYWGRRLPQGQGDRLRWLLRLDAVGLALFTLIGLRISLDLGLSPVMAIVVGCINGIVGGMVRDVLCTVTPSVLKEDLYATLSLLGGAFYVVLLPFTGDLLALSVSFAGMLVARLVVIEVMARP